MALAKADILGSTSSCLLIQFLFLSMRSNRFPTQQPFRQSAYSHTLSGWVTEKTLRFFPFVGMNIPFHECTLYLSCKDVNKVLLHSCVADKYHSLGDNSMYMSITNATATYLSANSCRMISATFPLSSCNLLATLSIPSTSSSFCFNALFKRAFSPSTSDKRA